MSITYLPRLSNLISSEDLSISKFTLLADNLDALLESIYYRNYTFDVSMRGDKRTIHLEIMLANQAGI